MAYRSLRRFCQASSPASIRRPLRPRHPFPAIAPVTTLADRYDGKRFNSHNDVVVRSDGSIWFTDPAYGIESDYEGFHAEPEQDGEHVYRIDQSGAITRVADDFGCPNGLAFSIDERTLFIADSTSLYAAFLPTTGHGMFR